MVRQAMARWPNVPAVFGWLSLDRRGTWLLQDEHISNPMLNNFIGRNYDRDPSGRWFFQNGPQRVFVRLAYAPWVLRTTVEGQLVTHTGLAVTAVTGLWFDEEGVVILQTEHGPGILDDRDVEAVAARFVATGDIALDEDTLLESIERIVAGYDMPLEFSYNGHRVAVGRLTSSEAPGRLGYVRDPQPELMPVDAAH